MHAAVLMEGKVRHLMPEEAEWAVIELLDILKPFQRATEAMGGVKYPTLSTVKPLLYKLSERTLKIADSDTATTKQVKAAIKKDLDERYQTPAQQRLMNLATYLDPRYKELPFLSSSRKRVVVDQVEDELMGMQPQPPPETLEEDETEEPQPKRQKKGPVTKLLGDLFKQQSQSCSHSDKVEKELNLYKAEQPADLDSNPLAWWKERKSLYPLMSKLVQKVLQQAFHQSGFSVPLAMLSPRSETALPLSMQIN